jgi:hypothetical protein
MSESMLNFSTKATDLPISIDGRRFVICHPNKLSLQHRIDFEALAPRALELLRAGSTITADQAKELGQALDTLCRLVLVAPEAVQRRLVDTQRVAVLNAMTAGAARGKAARRG